METETPAPRDEAYEIGPHTENDFPLALIGIGVALLLAEAFPSLFIYNDIFDRHGFFAVWMAIQTMLAVIFIGVGWMKHMKAKE